MCDCNLQCIMISLKCQYINWITRYLLFEHILTFVRFTKIFRIHQSHPKKTQSAWCIFHQETSSHLHDLTEQGLTSSRLIILGSLLFPITDTRLVPSFPPFAPGLPATRFHRNRLFLREPSKQRLPFLCVLNATSLTKDVATHVHFHLRFVRLWHDISTGWKIPLMLYSPSIYAVMMHILSLVCLVHCCGSAIAGVGWIGVFLYILRCVTD